jgi:hypothetical protein
MLGVTTIESAFESRDSNAAAAALYGPGLLARPGHARSSISFGVCSGTAQEGSGCGGPHACAPARGRVSRDWTGDPARPGRRGRAYVNEQARLLRAGLSWRDNGTGQVNTPFKG